MLTKRKKLLAIKKVQTHDKDTGSTGVQISLLSKKIDELSGHLKVHKKDNHSRRGLIKMVSNRRKTLGYMKKTNPKEHATLIKKLNLK